MNNQRHPKILIVSGLLLGALLGCSEEKTERMLNQETYSFTGVFENQFNGDLLEFKDAKVTIIKEQGLDYTKPFEVEDNYLTIQMRNSSKEKREDIVMRIHGQQELLTCSICAKYQLSATWRKRDFIPSQSN
ncbi:hypothetical protein LYZ37_21750 [Vibrio tubiashii]|uniref:hypothetical protein n=1 Tax=Vibrio tubiashii TaxID=29498 RepID=UPI00234F71D2|nr:hypothetical protein [Vibrio tubiashii]WCP69149.1 hypothetical protein LYZ37_21750 [Vibrio tubiashii]